MKKLSIGLAILLLGACVVVGLILPNHMLAAKNQTPKQTPGDLGIAYEDIYFEPEDEAVKLHGWWMPAENPKAILLMVHGANGSKEGRFPNSLEMYKALLAKDMSLLAIDLRNHGTSARSEQGELGMGIAERPDLIAALDQIELKNTQQLPIFSFGLSMGGAAVIHLAEADSRSQGLILFDPMLNTKDALELGAQASTGVPEWLAELVVWSTLQQRDFEPSAFDVARQQTLPTLLLQDVGDPVTRLEHAEALKNLRTDIEYRAFDDPASDHWIYEKHGAWGTHVAAFYFEPEAFIENIVSFVEKHSAVSAGQ
ncbi:alpha/beta hydrolase [Pseudoteredinibacter isoporae]|uniref:Pimeloyl-ACP methyl ester carboxylesterase n=1 Tax=Pseudoteredinibacter isoporae TaxID=570281 RepID=A0A7X0MUU2_9GAMM|nr:alpha/beta fold hydrolase [Pseudoteredinibacter isoporae]MBB6520653.1 pimeloyl-ACP methyl ester carboxylesterase [Pseudoteredinibacter isoporae]NHO86220.1 alpha/beta fold hydrolase [Pseudoteredinibacter isoporae]NIB25329.1 alpha/beta fold hydrolase [Pseudoteredinibacter isoporae]